MQGVLEQAIERVTGERAAVTAAGRTDAGAHAVAQVIAFSTASSLSTAVLRRALNAHLPGSVAITAVQDVGVDFHPRFDAWKRTYVYVIWNHRVRSPLYEGRASHVWRPLDVALMDVAAGHLVGRRDVSAFVPTAIDGERERDIYAARCHRTGDVVTIRLEASGFMKQMARAIAGTLIEVGTGARTGEEFAAVLRSGRRELAGRTAPAEGLYLVRVEYPAEVGIEQESEPDMALRLAPPCAGGDEERR